MDKNKLISELEFTAVRSSGAGGQHVNKVSSKIVLRFDIKSSNLLSDQQKTRLLEKLKHRINKNNTLIITCEESRSQHKNKIIAINKCFDLITEGLKRQKKRKPIKRSKSDNLKRLKLKTKQSLKKANRKKNFDYD